MNQGYREFNCNTAQEFWDTIRPENISKIINDNPHDLIFRGQADANWSLTPNVYRRTIASTSLDQAFYEYIRLKYFLSQCDMGGIVVPGYTNELKKQLKEFPNNYGKNPVHWPMADLYEVLAYAQHYGLPTRLLDWTRSAFVASYFAVSDVVKLLANEILNDSSKLCNLDKKFALWVLDIERINIFNGTNDDHRNNICLIEVPSATNSNIAAQRGCFTVLRNHQESRTEFNRNFTLDHFFSLSPIPTPLTKITVPYSEVLNVLNLCHQYNLHQVCLYPNTYGAADGSMESFNSYIIGEHFKEFPEFNKRPDIAAIE